MYALYPIKEQRAEIVKTIDACRFVYNKLLERQKKIYVRRSEHFSSYDMMHVVAEMKVYLPWLVNADSRALQDVCKRLDSAYRNFFSKRAGFPSFKSKRKPVQSYTTIGCIRVSDRYVKLPKIGSVRAKVKRLPSGAIKNATVSVSSTGRIYVSVVVDEVPVKLPAASGVIGLDMGVDSLATDSNGVVYENPKNGKKHAKRLARAQQSLSRKKKGSNNYEKQRKRVAEIHEKIKNERNDHHQKLSTMLIRDNQTVCIEDLSIREMVKRKGGRCGVSGRRFAFSVLDAGWGDFVRMLEYKAKWHDRVIVKVDRFFPSSQICHVCGHKNPEVKDLRIRKWTCPQCGSVHDRDVNAAINILNKGLEMLHP